LLFYYHGDSRIIYFVFFVLDFLELVLVFFVLDFFLLVLVFFVLDFLELVLVFPPLYSDAKFRCPRMLPGGDTWLPGGDSWLPGLGVDAQLNGEYAVITGGVVGVKGSVTVFGEKDCPDVSRSPIVN
jgi:hypothetical protein